MIDIVERLREYCGSPYCVQLRAEAADEIERLRALVRVAYWEGADQDISWDESETRRALEGK